MSVAGSRSPGFICTDSNTPSGDARRDVKSIVAVTRSINHCAGRLTIVVPFVRVVLHIHVRLGAIRVSVER